MDVYLRAPDGTQVELFTDVGEDGRNFTNTILDPPLDELLAELGEDNLM